MAAANRIIGSDPEKTLFERVADQLIVHSNIDKADIPQGEPVIFAMNHPYGIVDASAAMSVLGDKRPDIKIMAHNMMSSLPDMEPFFPVDFNETEESRRINKQSITDTLRFLKNGGALGICPSGAVMTTPSIFDSKAEEGPWSKSLGFFAQKTGAQVIPVHVDGQCGRLFQIASHLSLTARLSLLLYENLKLRGQEINVTFGDPIDPKQHQNMTYQEFSDFARAKTIALGGGALHQEAQVVTPLPVL